MIIENEAQITAAVEEAMSRTPDLRLREVMAAFVRHAHAFVREVRPTEEEFEAGMRFLVALGQATNAVNNEVVLAADVVGISSLVGLLNNETGCGQTAAALLGPFWRANAPHYPLGANLVQSETPGEALFVSGVVRDTNGAPVAGASVDVWHASPVGLYENQDPEQAEMNLRGLFTTDERGRYYFRSVRPAGYPVPTGGPIGDLLRAQVRHPYRPAHVHFMVTRPGFKTLVTQIFSDDAEHLNTDVTFSVIRSIVGRYVRHESGPAPAKDVTSPFYTLEYDFVLEPGEMRIPVPPIE
ncbi:MAG TPA: dioxygenase [Caulobacteraceae bacterium]|jgi:protocatechuate 3,4-dioxygenase beta subunit|nr:dioxygenase [Caulobacteraceae bacterium]